jgi:hypothetical protein
MEIYFIFLNSLSRNDYDMLIHRITDYEIAFFWITNYAFGLQIISVDYITNFDAYSQYITLCGFEVTLHQCPEVWERYRGKY